MNRELTSKCDVEAICSSREANLNRVQLGFFFGDSPCDCGISRRSVHRMDEPTLIGMNYVRELKSRSR